MAQNTTRDKVWAAALDTAREKADGSRWSRRFGVDDVLAHLEGSPSRRTVRDVLKSMSASGWLRESVRQGQYEPSGWFNDAAEALEERDDQGVSDDVLETGNVVPDDVETRNVSSARRDDETEDNFRDRERGHEHGREDDQESSADDPLAQLDVPGDDERIVELRRDAARAAVEHVKEDGPVQRQDLLDEVGDEHPAGYTPKPRGSWWRKVVRPGLEEHPDVANSGNEWVAL
jgi:hypothetical protein